MAYDAGGYGYDPYDNSNQFMQDWFKAASKPDADIAAAARQFRALTSSPRRSRAVNSVPSPLQGFNYGNYKGVPNEWFYEFAKKKKAEFEEHVRSLGYEIDLADTPGLGKLSELPATPDYLETIIPPAYNIGVNFRDPYLQAVSDAAGQDDNQAHPRMRSRASPPQDTDDTESEYEDGQPGPVSQPFRYNPFDEEDSPVLQPTTFNRRESIDDSSSGSHNDDGDFSADLNDSVNTANLIAYGQQQASTIRDDSTFHQYEFINAGVDLTTCDIIDNHMASQGTGLEGSHLVIDEQDELEKDQASDSFFDGTRVDESPTPHHQPVVDQESGFANIREGLENFPQQWTYPKEDLNNAEHEVVNSRAGSWPPVVQDHVDMTRGSDNPVYRTILKPVSQKAKARAISQIFPELIGDIPSFIDHRQRKYRAKPPAPIVTHNLYTQASFLEVALAKQAASAKKRQADYTFATKSAVLSLSSAGGTKVRGSKKSRPNDFEPSSSVITHTPVQSAPYDDTQDYPSFAGDQDDLETPLLPGNAEKQTEIDFSKSGLPPLEQFASELYRNQLLSPGNRFPTISPITPEAQLADLPTPLTPEPPAYAGQFNGISLSDLYHLAHQKVTDNTLSTPLKFTFGDRIHANPLLTHPCIPSHPPTLPIGALNYTHNTLPPNHHLHARLDALSCSVDLAASTPVALHRTPSQEALRTEAHRELAAARLEGFPVGEYRYYQGHLSVEEYIENGMCVCWSACGCSGWCSRFGDLICPCHRVLLPNEDDDDDDKEDAAAAGIGEGDEEEDMEAGYESEEGFEQLD